MTTTNNKLGDEIGTEGRSIYLNRDEPLEYGRFVVTFAVAYGPGDDISSPEMAAAAALSLTQDEDSGSTCWFVFDRETGEHHCFDQNDFNHFIKES